MNFRATAKRPLLVHFGTILMSAQGDIYLSFSMSFIDFGQTCSNFLPLRASQKQTTREHIIFGVT